MKKEPLFFAHLDCERGHRAFWFRLFGWGLHIGTRKRSQAFFSERYGYRRALYVFGLRFEILRP